MDHDQPSDDQLIDATPLDPVEEEQAARESVRNLKWFDAAGEREAWPINSRLAARLMRLGGSFAIGDDQLEVLVRRGVFLDAPAIENDEYEWSATDVLRVANLLELRRQWLRGSIHLPKQTRQEICLGVAIRDNEVDVLGKALESFDARGLIQAMARSDQPEVRQQIAGLLEAVLLTQHEVSI